MFTIEVSSFTGTTPLSIIICDMTITYCYVVATNVTSFPIIVNVPSQFTGITQFIIKIVDARGCEKFEVIFCPDKAKLFEDGVIFIFMDSPVYIFEDQ
jgi:hypothetical protein